jgi:hypothetical protein
MADWGGGVARAQTELPGMGDVSPVFSQRRMLALAPIVLTFAYPFVLKLFLASVVGPDALGWGAGAILFALLMSVPIVGLIWAQRIALLPDAPAPFFVRARQLAYCTMIAPPLYVFIGVTRGLVGRPLTDETVWLGVWCIALACVWLRADKPVATAQAAATAAATTSRWRVAHGVSAAFIVLFVGFHLTNHLTGLIGPDLHASIMHAGRAVYRAPLVEVVLVGFLLFQAVSGIRLAVRWSRTSGDAFRVFQIGSGVYIAAFLITHLNSALVSARWVRHIETDWAWASGAPEGLLYDAWNIRLVPHYAFGVLFVLSHLFSGLRLILIAHGANVQLANRIWFAGLAISAVVACAIMAGLLGMRV